MQISELAERSGLSVSTIKYYLREGLLPAGEKLGQRRADYSDRHTTRLHLLRVLRDVGDIPVADLKEIIDAVEDNSRSVHQKFGAAYDALARSYQVASDEARVFADEVIQQAGWTQVRPDSPARNRLADLLATLDDLGAPFDLHNAATYLGIVDTLAAYEVGTLGSRDPAEDHGALMQQMVVGQVVFGQILLSLRRLAHEHHSALRFRDQLGQATNAADALDSRGNFQPVDN